MLKNENVWRRMVWVFVVLVIAAARPETALAQVHRAPNSCGDGSTGASIVARSPVSPNDGFPANIMIYRGGAFADTYEQELRYMVNPIKTDSLEAVHAALGHEARWSSSMQVVYNQAHFTRADDAGTILCGDLLPGDYHIMVVASIFSMTSSNSERTVKYYLAHAVVPNSQGRRLLIRATPFVELKAP